MSNVKMGQRNESKVQFIDTARELVVHTMKYAKKFPKSAMFIITKDLVDLSREIYKCVVCANRAFPNSQRAVDARYGYFTKALGCIDALDCFLGIAKDAYNTTDISDYGWSHWGELLVKEENLIKKILASDAKITF